MWEAYGLNNEDILWSCIAFIGGIGGQQAAPCGALSASAVCLGFRHRCSIKDKVKAKQSRTLIRQQASELVNSFLREFGAINCLELIGLDLSTPKGYQQFLKNGVWKLKCNRHIEFVIDKLYSFEKNENNKILPLLER